MYNLITQEAPQLQADSKAQDYVFKVYSINKKTKNLHSIPDSVKSGTTTEEIPQKCRMTQNLELYHSQEAYLGLC